MNNRQGKFYGVGVGPGDPELLTLKALKCIRECDVLAIPVSAPESMDVKYGRENEDTKKLLEACVAYQIVKPVCPEATDKDMIFLPMPMIKDKELLNKVHDTCAQAVAELIQGGKDVCFITLGDPTVYSTCMYVHDRVKQMGCATAVIPGVTSFCAAAARLDMAIAGNREEIHIIPASYQVEDSLKLPGTKVLMKAGKKMAVVKETIRKENLQVRMVENCGMETEKVYECLEEIPDQASYYSLMILKEER